MDRARRAARAVSVALATGLVVATLGTAVGHADEAPAPRPSPTPTRTTQSLPPPEEATDTRLRSRSTVLDGTTSPSSPDRSLVAGTQSTPAANRVVGQLYAAGGSTIVRDSALNSLASVTDRRGTRLAGPDRFATAARISATGYPSGSSAVYLATGENFPDGLAASRAAGQHGAPLLLTQTAVLPTATRQELIRLRPSRVVIVGGTGVVTGAVQTAVRQALPNASVARLAGADRYATAAALSRADSGAPKVAFVATGTNFPDALAAGPVAAQFRGPLLLTGTTTLPAATATELARTRPQTTYVVGGPDVVSNGVSAKISAATGGKVVRVSGADRFATAAALSHLGFARTTTTIVLATGLNFPDALAAGALAGQRHGPVLLDTGKAIAPRSTVDEARRVSWYVGTASAPVLRYIPETHPDDHGSALSLLQPMPGRYDVHILLTRGEGTGNCNGGYVSTPWMKQEYLPQPQPTGLRYSDRCREHRVSSWNVFLDRLAGPDDPMGPVQRHPGSTVTWQGRTLPTPTHLIEDGTNKPADYVDVAIGPHSARFVFDLGDGQLNPDKVIWAIENTRLLRSLLPTQSEGDIVGAGYYNITGKGSPYTHPDHKVLHDVLGTADFGLPGSQYSPIGHADPARAFGAWDESYCRFMCHPADPNGWTSRMGDFQFSYGWLDHGRWDTGTLDVYAGFSEYQSFGKWF